MSASIRLCLSSHHHLPSQISEPPLYFSHILLSHTSPHRIGIPPPSISSSDSMESHLAYSFTSFILPTRPHCPSHISHPQSPRPPIHSYYPKPAVQPHTIHSIHYHELPLNLPTNNQQSLAEQVLVPSTSNKDQKQKQDNANIDHLRLTKLVYTSIPATYTRKPQNPTQASKSRTTLPSPGQARNSANSIWRNCLSTRRGTRD